MRQILRFILLTSAAVLAALPLLSAQEPKRPPQLKKVSVADGVELHYVERGKGVPVVFVHGGLVDYTAWENQLAPFAESYRAIAYSCRYNYPNTNKLQPKYSAVVEAEDLAALIKKLDLGKVHVVGLSYGAYTALFLAVKHPDLVRSLVLAEPPVHFRGDPLDEARADGKGGASGIREWQATRGRSGGFRCCHRWKSEVRQVPGVRQKVHFAKCSAT